MKTANIGRKSTPAPEPEPEPESEADEPPNVQAEAEAPAPRPSGKSRVNGVEQDDPPQVARQRAKGLIPPSVVPEVTEPEPADQPEPEPEPEPASPDEEWLASLPARSKLGADARARFDRDALGYRAIDGARKAFGHAVRSTLKAADRRGGSLPGYLYRVSGFLTTNDPARWVACPAPSDGGCGGTGTIGVLGKCPKCHGDGYLV